MKKLLLTAVLFASSLAPAVALTDADLDPAALLGKTLTFTIRYGGAPFAKGGTWSGSFANTGNAFTAAKITGDFVDVATTYTTTVSGGFTNVSLAEIVKGQRPATLALYTQGGVGQYEVSIDGIMGVSLNGSFTLATTVAPAPEISVQLPGGKELTDGKAKNNFGPVKVGKASPSKTFTIKNTGTTPLTGIALAKTGTGAGDFTVSKLAKKTLEPGASLTFKATFKPKTAGAKKAVLKIKSNDQNESPFDIAVSGSAVK